MPSGVCPIRETFGQLATIIDQIHMTGAAVILVGVKGGIWGDIYKKEFEKLEGRKAGQLRVQYSQRNLWSSQLDGRSDSSQ